MQLLEHFASLTLHPKNAQELKGLILQLAIQGKLTANWRKENPDIEPASKLLRKINVNKETLFKLKKIRKETAKKEFLKVNVSYSIPNSWISQNITEFYSTIGSKHNQIQSKNYNEIGKYPIVSQGKNIIDGYSDDESKLLKITKPVVVFGDHTRLVKYVDFDFIIGADGTKIMIPFDGIDSNYFYLHISSYDLSSKGYARHFSLLKLEAFALPPLEEQKEIVRVVEILFKEVEQLEQLTVERIALKEDYVTSALQQLTTQNSQKEWQFLQPHFKDFFTEKSTIKKLRETVLQLAVQGKLTADWRSCHPELVSGTNHASELLERIQKEKAQLVKDKKIKKESPLPAITAAEIPYELPEGWVWANILEISLKVTDGEHATPIRTESGYKLLSARNVTNEGIRLHKVDYVGEEEFQRIRKRCDPQKGDILISCSGSVGRVCLVDKDDEYCMVRSAALVKHHHEYINGMFLCYALRSPILQEQILEKSRSTAQSNLFLGKIKELTFPLPPLEEQKTIVEKVNALMGLCDALEQEVAQSKAYSEQLMQSVLREVFEGEKTEIHA